MGGKVRYEYCKANGICYQCGKVGVVGYVYCDECRTKDIERKKKSRIMKELNGVCYICGDVAEKGKHFCKSCLYKEANKTRLAREYRKSLGLCVNCGKEKAIAGETLCLVCKMDRRNQRHKAKPYNRDVFKARYDGLKSKGLCTKCGKVSATHGLLCDRCYSKILIKREANRNTLSRSERVSHNLCYICGSSDLVEGKKVCKKCYEVRLRSMSKIMYLSKKEKNLDYWDKMNGMVLGKGK